MAFGDLLSTSSASNSNTSIPNPFSVTAGLSAVGVGDLIIAVVSEETAVTTTAVTDNLGNTYVALNAGTAGGGISVRGFYSRVTVSGTLTSVNFATTASTHNASVCVAIFAGPFVVSPLDRNPANSSGSLTNCPASGPLAQASEVVVSYGAADDASSHDGMSTGTLAVHRGLASASCSIGYTVKTNTSGVTHVFTNSGAPTQAQLGTSSFKADLAVGQPTVKRYGGVPFAYSIGRGVW